MLRGANDIRKVLEKRIGEQRHVSADGKFAWLEVECLGACCNAPMVQINDDYFEDLTVENFEKLLDDLAAVIDASRSMHQQRGQLGLPLILIGHSLGGLVAGRFVSLQLRAVDALVMSSPALDPGLSALQKVLVATLPAIAPNLRVNNGLEPRYLSHDPAVVAAYRADPLVHPKISARLARFIATAGPATVAAAAHWCVPTLLLYAGADRLVNPAGSRAFAAVAGASAQVPPGILSAQVFESLYHEIFNEALSAAAPVYAALKTWLDARF
jgi:alpha-beta hydrolase superfamily lysophospholipase